MDAHFSINFRFRTTILMVFVFFIFSRMLIAQPVLQLGAPVITGLSQPMQIVNAGDGTGRYFVVHKGGLIKCYDKDFNFLSDFLTVTNITSSGERGLLSMAFHPDYKTNGLFYVYYTGNESGKVGALTIARYKVSTGNANLADVASKKIVLEILHPRTNHNGGQLHFDQAGYLFLTTGDGGGGGDPDENSQDQTKLLGKLLRMEVNTSDTPPYYSIPTDNPFGNEVYCLGLRNPYRWSFDRLNGDIWIGDVGQSNWEELDHVVQSQISGTNFGWDCYEGNASYEPTGCLPSSNYKFPFHVYSLSGAQSVTGGVVYRGAKYPSLYGWYVGAEFYNTDFHRVFFDGTNYTVAPVQNLGPGSIVNFGEAEDGEVYVVSLYEGEIYPLQVDEGPLPVRFISLGAHRMGLTNLIEWTAAEEEGSSHYEIESCMDGTTFKKIGYIHAKASGKSGIHSYIFSDIPNSVGKMYYRVKAVDVNNSYRYSDIVTVVDERSRIIVVYPTLVQNDEICVYPDSNNDHIILELFNTNGQLMGQRTVAPGEREVRLPINNATPGVYYVRVTSGHTIEMHKIVKPMN